MINQEEEAREERVAERTAEAVAEATWPQTRAILRIIFIILTVAAAIWIVYALQLVLLLVVLSVFFAYLVAPLVELVRAPLKRRGRAHWMPRPLAIAVVYLFLFGSIGLCTYVLLPSLGNQMTQLAQNAPTYLMTARGRAQSLNSLYQRYHIPGALREAANNTVTRAIEATGESVSHAMPTMVGWLVYVPWMVLIPILAFFLLRDADSFRYSALQMLPTGRWRWRGDEFFQDVNSTMAGYVRAQLTACLLIGAICTLVFVLIGLPYALVIGIIAGFLEFIPLVGPLAVAIIAGIVASFYSINLTIVTLLFLLVLRIVHDYAIYPRIVGQNVHLHPLAVILAILSGAELAGAAGIFLAIPVVAVISVSYRHWLEHRGSTGLVAEILKPAEDAVTAPAEEDKSPVSASLK
jgi:predicted PurR-regulated permease PerM